MAVSEEDFLSLEIVVDPEGAEMGGISVGLDVSVSVDRIGSKPSRNFALEGMGTRSRSM